jgi:glycerol-3-phosphate responsive antiterminator
MNHGILGLNGGRKKEGQPVSGLGKGKAEITSINTPQLTRLGERTIKMFELHREMIKALQKNAFELMTVLGEYEEIDGIINKDDSMIANTPETRYAVIQASFAIETMFSETGGKIWQELADRLRRQVKHKNNA